MGRKRRSRSLEGGGDGRPPTFDGNDSRRIRSWLIPFPGSAFVPLTDEQYSRLMEWTVQGHLAWVVFPIDNR